MYPRIIRWLRSHGVGPHGVKLLLADCGITLAAGVAAYVFNHGFVLHLGRLLEALLLCECGYLAGFLLLRTYNSFARQFPYGELLRAACALAIGVLLVQALRWGLPEMKALALLRRRDLLLQVIFALAGMYGLRGLVKLHYDFYVKRSNSNGAYGLSDIALLNMEMSELLRRDPIEVNTETIRREMHGKRILVTGAGGSIGSELVRLLAGYGPEMLVLVDQAETPLHEVRMMLEREYPAVPYAAIVTDVCHSPRMECIFGQYRPEILFHAAAYKHVPMMEDNPVESVLNNVDGTVKLADLAVRFGVDKFVMISTDKAVNPTNIMGCSKRICEIYCQSLARAAERCGRCQFITTRFGNVLGSNGSVVPIFREQIRRGGPVQVTHPDIIRYFMLIPEACRLVLEAATLGHGGEIFVFDMGEPVRIAELARQMIRISRRDDIRIVYTGLRPGEKLYEEVLTAEEKVLPTTHAKIKIAQVREYDFDAASRRIRELIEVARTYDAAATVHCMEQLVPEFNHTH